MLCFLDLVQIYMEVIVLVVCGRNPISTFFHINYFSNSIYWNIPLIRHTTLGLYLTSIQQLVSDTLLVSLLFMSKNQSYFCHFVKNHSNSSPSTYTCARVHTHTNTHFFGYFRIIPMFPDKSCSTFSGL